MRTKEEVITQLEHILNDERFWYKPALVDVNAPLALIQVGLTERFLILCWMLEKPTNLIKSMWQEKGRLDL